MHSLQRWPTLYRRKLRRLCQKCACRFADLKQGVVLTSTHRGNEFAALFLPTTREILLARNLDPATPLARSYLVHELVHAQEFAKRANVRSACSGALEGEAYNLQALYLSLHGHNAALMCRCPLSSAVERTSHAGDICAPASLLASFNHNIRTSDQRRRQRHPDSGRSPQVDDGLYC